MTAALIYPEKVSQSSTKQREIRLLKQDFGDGYSQRTPDGINYKKDIHSIVYENMSGTERNAIWAWISTVDDGTLFTYTRPGDTEQKYIIEGNISESVLAGDVYTINFTIKQVFDL